jgi:hypothetical protein
MEGEKAELLSYSRGEGVTSGLSTKHFPPWFLYDSKIETWRLSQTLDSCDVSVPHI